MNKDTYVLKLLLVGQASKSVESINNIKAIFENEFKGQYSLETIDLIDNPELAEGDKVLATPTSMKFFPGSVRETIGDLSDKDKITAVRLKINKILQ